MRDRLIELIDGFVFGTQIIITNLEWNSNTVKDFADHLIANGVIVPPYKVGAKVFVITSQTSNGKNLYIVEDRITHYRICDGCTIMCLENHLGVPSWDWDKVFISREDAERALEEVNDDKA